MRWVRANRKFGGRLALFALAVQLTLSFGHIHPEDIFGPARVAADASIAVPAADHSGPLSTDQHSSHNDDYCAICATMYLLASSSVPEPPQLLPLPFASQPIEHFDGVTAVFIAPRRPPFQSRAPPLA
jgi:hypothetical protein